jgi:uncharacterized protein
MIDNVREKVKEVLSQDNSGHGIEHVERVLRLSLQFAEAENANKDVAALIALLHDVDDYKLFGAENAANLTNANTILDQCGVDNETKDQVLNAIKKIGYSKRLKGIAPDTIEGMVVSDADMCDAIGATGIIRSHQYALAHHDAFFDKTVFPSINMTSEEYKEKSVNTTVNHMFEKLLTLKDMMLTESGKAEALKRQDIMIDFLKHIFEEEDAPEWSDYLNKYINMI